MGRRKKSEIGETVPVGSNVRWEVVNTLFQNPNHEVMIPSAMDLARKFNISRPTVTRELKKLTDEGYIIGKRGVGTFTNPKAFPNFGMISGKKIIGILNMDARLLYYGYTDWAMMAQAGLALPPDIGHPRPVMLSSSQPEAVYRELKAMNLDGLIWILPRPEIAGTIQQLRKDGLPVVTMIKKVPGIPFIGIDTNKAGGEIAAKFIELGKTDVLWCAYNEFSENLQSGAKRFFAEKSIEPEKLLTACNRYDCEQKLPQLLREKRVNAVFVHEESTERVSSLLEEHGGSEEYCLAVEAVTVRRIPGFKGITRNYPFEQMGRKAAEWIQVLLQEPRALENAETLYDMEIT